MIDIIKVDKKIKDKSILNNISIHINKGNCVGFIGHNGSGKSMLLKSICGFTPISNGEILVDENKIKFGENFIKNAGIIIEQPSFINHLTAFENLVILADIRKIINKEEILQTLEEVGLSHAKDQKVKEFSLGMKQRLRIAQAIMEKPEVLILDEPFNGLDKESITEVQNILIEQKNSGVTIILTSHDERQINLLCDEVYEFNRGALI